MSNQLPQLGSKISLISKADIRYEGQLFTVDPEHCTIALASVRSFGTEHRDTQYPVPAQTQVYDYILFRGSDIKDIRVVNPQIPNDPAIVQLVPPSSSEQPIYQQQPYMAPAMGQFPSYTQMGGLGGLTSNSLGGLQRAPGPGPMLIQPSELIPTSESQPHQQSATVNIGSVNSIDKEQDLIGGGSRSTTPSLTRKSPTADQGTQVNESPREQKKPRPIQPPQRESRDRQPSSQQQQQQQQPQQQQSREQQPAYNAGQKNNQQRDRDNYQQRDGYQRKTYRQRDSVSRERERQDRENRGPRGDNNRQQYQNQNRGLSVNSGGWGGGPSHHMQVGQQQNQRMNQRQRGTRPRGPPKFNNNQQKKNTLKFESDYDFDKANTEFEELRSQLAKIKVGGDDDVSGLPPSDPNTSTVNPPPVTEVKINGEIEKKEDSGNETFVVEGDVDDDQFETCYDKSKSFFDTISCEAVERSKGRSQRTDWRTERKLNSETFGVSSARRGGYNRGRGYYGNRNYRPQGGYRPRGPPRNMNPVNVDNGVAVSVPLQGVAAVN